MSDVQPSEKPPGFWVDAELRILVLRLNLDELDHNSLSYNFRKPRLRKFQSQQLEPTLFSHGPSDWTAGALPWWLGRGAVTEEEPPAGHQKQSHTARSALLDGSLRVYVGGGIRCWNWIGDIGGRYRVPLKFRCCKPRPQWCWEVSSLERGALTSGLVPV